jgi:hypothetical protein
LFESSSSLTSQNTHNYFLPDFSQLNTLSSVHSERARNEAPIMQHQFDYIVDVFIDFVAERNSGGDHM